MSFSLPADPDVRASAVLVIGAVVVLLIIGRVFRDVNPS